MSGIRSVWLYANNIIRSARQLVNAELKFLNLSSAEGNILLHLLTQGDCVHQEDIVEKLDISKPAVSRALESLGLKGYVTRSKDEKDKRASLVVLTERARAIGPEIEKIYEEAFSVAARDLSETEIKNFTEIFRQVSDNFTSAKKERKKQ